MKRVSVFVLTATLLVPATPSHGVVEVLAAGWTIGNTLDHLEEAASNVLELAGAQAQGTVMEAGQGALNVIGALRWQYREMLNDTVGSLTELEQRAFEDARVLLSEAERVADGLVADLGSLSAQANRTLAQIPGIDSIPLVQEISPQYFVRRSGVSPVIRVSGMNLADGDPYLELYGRVVMPVNETDGELTFELPTQRSVGPKNNGEGDRWESTGASEDPIEGRLVVFERRSKWFFLSDYESRDYRIVLFPVPDQVGDYSVHIVREVPGEEFAERVTPSYRCESPNGSGRHVVPIGVAASPEGWQILPKTIRFRASYQNHGSHTLKSSSAAGFTAELSCHGFGKVSLPLVGTVDRGSKGVISGEYLYREAKSTQVKVVEEIKQGSLRWQEDVPLLDLPGDTKTVSVTLNLFTGKTVNLQGRDGHRFAELEYNAAAKTARLRSRSADEALGSQ